MGADILRVLLYYTRKYVKNTSNELNVHLYLYVKVLNHRRDLLFHYYFNSFSSVLASIGFEIHSASSEIFRFVSFRLHLVEVNFV